MMRSFTSLRTLHERLDQLFLLHQESLLDQDPEEALERLDRYELALRDHLQLEEEYLLPIYRRAGRIPGGPEEFYLGEHAKLLALLLRCRELLLELLNAPGDRRRGLIGLFDQEAVLKSLTLHHHQREENILFPTLDEVTEVAERCRLISLFLGEESET